MATLTLRPSAAGAECSIASQSGCSACPNHYDCVDEEVADDTGTEVRTNVTSYQRDLYNLPVSDGIGTINKITVYFRCEFEHLSCHAKASIKSDSTVTDGTEKTAAFANTWETFTQEWATNPADSQPWEWSDINALQIGVSLKGYFSDPFAYIAACTQVYVEIDYDQTGEVLRPNGAGDVAGISWQVPGSGAHWEKVDEVTPDESTTYVYSTSFSWEYDLYAIPDSGVGEGEISQIEVFIRCRIGAGIGYDAKTALKTHDTVYFCTVFYVDTSWTNYSQVYTTNPNTETAWTWAEINALQIGVALYAGPAECTQVWVVITYTPSTPKTSSDTGSGVEAKASGNPIVTHSRSESGSGTEVSPGRGFIMAEAGQGVDTHIALAPISAGETGSGVDAVLSFLAALTRADSGVGVDTTLSHLVSLVKSDSGAGVEHLLDRALVIVQTGSGVEASSLLKALLVSDSGSGAESSYKVVLGGIKTSSDTGTGADAKTGLEAALIRGDTGSGAEQVIARALAAKEYPAGAVDLAQVLTAAITGTGETGTGAEASIKSLYFLRTQTGSGVESSTLEAMLQKSDTGSGAEAITLLAAFLSSDSGQSVDKVLSYLRQLVDSGQGAEVVHLIGIVGRVMHLFTYLREYCALTVYTSEVKNN